jgi:hypothetical protein
MPVSKGTVGTNHHDAKGEWLDSFLWLLYSLWAIWHVSTRYHDAGEVGEAEVQVAKQA